MVFKDIKCKICGKSFDARRAIGQPKPKYCCRECVRQSKKGKPATEKQKEILKYWSQGERNCKWNGGGKNWWRKQVLQRDDYTCQVCELRDETEGFMDTHHIKRVVDFPELKCKVSNGMTLCPNCHKRKSLKERHYRSENNSGRFKKK